VGAKHNKGESTMNDRDVEDITAKSGTADTQTRTLELIRRVEDTHRTAYTLAAEHPDSECLHEAWASLDAARTLLHRYLRLLREAG
jgi:hypothetical protein